LSRSGKQPSRRRIGSSSLPAPPIPTAMGIKVLSSRGLVLHRCNFSLGLSM
jgi:hypothetical protein